MNVNKPTSKEWDTNVLFAQISIFAKIARLSLNTHIHSLKSRHQSKLPTNLLPLSMMKKRIHSKLMDKRWTSKTSHLLEISWMLFVAQEEEVQDAIEDKDNKKDPMVDVHINGEENAKRRLKNKNKKLKNFLNVKRKSKLKKKLRKKSKRKTLNQSLLKKEKNRRSQ